LYFSKQFRVQIKQITVASHPFSWEIPVEFAQMEHEKTTLVLESGFGIYSIVK
jgi:hypothetical protein